MPNENSTEVERLTRLFTRLIDRESKRRSLDTMKVCGALGAAAGLVVGVNVSRESEADRLMLGVMAAGFGMTLQGVREKSAH